MEGQNVEVIIVGAGVAGLAAADILKRAGVQVVVLEGRDRVGGRVHTLHTNSIPVPIELGAEFIHGRPDEIWNIVRDKMLPVAEVEGNNFCFEEGKLRKCNDFWTQWEQVSNAMELDHGQDEPFLSFLRRLASKEQLPERIQNQAVEYVEGFNAANASEISLQSLIQDRDASKEVEGEHIFHLISGYDGVVNNLAVSPDVHLLTTVQEVRWKPGQVKMRAVYVAFGDLPEFEAKAAIITVPVAILQSDSEHASMKFLPEIPETIRAARNLKMGNVVKAVLCFNEPFWAQGDLEKLSFLHTPNQPFRVFWTTAPLITSVLTGWAGGPAADALAGSSQDRILDAAIQSLAAAVNRSTEDVRSNLKHSSIADWRSDRFALGAYSYAPSGHLDARAALARPVEDTLFFAGEATNTEGFSGTVHGAIVTGRRAAREALTAIRNSRRAA
jgi:monoamine oxidase